MDTKNKRCLEVKKILRESGTAMTIKSIHAAMPSVHIATVRKIVNSLCDNLEVHIAKYVLHDYHYVAHYALGCGDDAPSPKAIRSRKQKMGKIPTGVYEQVLISQRRGVSRVVLQGLTVWDSSLGFIFKNIEQVNPLTNP